MTGPYVALCLSKEAYEAVLKRMKLARDSWPTYIKNEQSDAATHFFENNGRLAAVVCVGNGRDIRPLEMAGLLVHEAVHIWQAHAEHISESAPSAEMEAYAIQAIAQNLMQEYVQATQ